MPKPRTIPDEVREYIRENSMKFSSILANEIQEKFGVRIRRSTIVGLRHRMGVPAPRNGGRRRRSLLNEEQMEFFRQNQANVTRARMAEMLNEKYGTNVTMRQVKDLARYWGLKSNNDGRLNSFSPRRSYPVGAEVAEPKDGYIYVKTGEPAEWKLKHHVIWENVHGPLPDGMQVMFLDGNKLNFDVGNLMAVTIGERTGARWLIKKFDDAELSRTALGIQRIKRLVKEMEGEE